jgi:hypothetical protein
MAWREIAWEELLGELRKSRRFRALLQELLNVTHALQGPHSPQAAHKSDHRSRTNIRVLENAPA